VNHLRKEKPYCCFCFQQPLQKNVVFFLAFAKSLIIAFLSPRPRSFYYHPRPLRSLATAFLSGRSARCLCLHPHHLSFQGRGFVDFYTVLLWCPAASVNPHRSRSAPDILSRSDVAILWQRS